MLDHSGPVLSRYWGGGDDWPSSGIYRQEMGKELSGD
jgi:hypothetical protein